MLVQLNKLQAGQQALITGFSPQVDKVHRHRLLAMGLTRGATVSFVRKAPLGDPIEIEVRGFHLALRQQEAMVIEVKLLPDTEAVAK